MSKNINIRNILITIVLLLVVAFIIAYNFTVGTSLRPSSKPNIPQASNPPVSMPVNNPPVSTQFVLPLDQALERVTKKPFGIYITPTNSPVSPEQFKGYHTGVDFETFSNEASATVSVRAICSGTFKLVEYVKGYGGVAVESCELDKKPITVIYGHLNLKSIKVIKNQKITAGEVFAELGKGYSTETDGERKHLHLGIRRGSTISILGYVQAKKDLAAWIDPLGLLK